MPYKSRQFRGFVTTWAVPPGTAPFRLHFCCIPMALNEQDVARIARLARIELTAAESGHMLAQINDFFDIVERMRAVDTTGVEPLTHPVAIVEDIALRLRDDLASEPNQRQANQRSAPAVENGLFLVPKVIE